MEAVAGVPREIEVPSSVFGNATLNGTFLPCEGTG